MERNNKTEINAHGLPNIVIPAEVLFNENLTAREMILFGHVYNMSYNEYGYCWASNRYLGRLINVRPDTISTMLTKLADYYYLILEYEKRYDGVHVRRIYINKQYSQIYHEYLKGALEKIKRPFGKYQKGEGENTNNHLENAKEPISKTQNNINNNIENNINNNISPSELNSEGDDEIDNNQNNPSKENKKPTAKERKKEYLPLAQYLSEIIQSQKKIKINTKKLNQWADDIRILVETDEIDYDRVQKALDWYSQNIGRKYIPQIYCGSSLRNKFLYLEDAINREFPNQSNNNPQNNSKSNTKRANEIIDKELTHPEARKRFKKHYFIPAKKLLSNPDKDCVNLAQNIVSLVYQIKSIQEKYEDVRLMRTTDHFGVVEEYIEWLLEQDWLKFIHPRMFALDNKQFNDFRRCVYDRDGDLDIITGTR